jgi:hypothetical protein
MAIHKLNLEDFDQIDYNLIAIHTVQEDYKLAYKINQKLGISLFKNDKEIQVDIENNTALFSRFTFDDQENRMIWDLIQNKNKIELPVLKKTIDLFENKSFYRKISLVSELKNVDFLLKIEFDSQIKIKNILNKLNKIDSISTVYEVNVQEMKSKNNLIF